MRKGELLILPVLFLLAIFSIKLITAEGNPLKFLFLFQIVTIFCLIALLDIKSSIILVFLWLPFKGLVRRLFYLIAPFTRYDVIHLTEALYLSFLMIYLLLRMRKEISEEYSRNKIFRVYLFLLFIFFLQIFNPLQGNILVGLAGAIYMIFPALWFIFGLLFGDEEFVKRILKVISVTAFITAIYGIFQFFYGLMPFEEYWVKNVQKGYVTIKMWGHPRAFSSFMSPDEASRFFATGGAIMTGNFVLERGVLSIPFLIPILLALIFTGVRSGVFSFLFAVLIIFSLTAKEIKRAFIRGVIIFFAIYALLELFISPPPRPAGNMEVSQVYYFHIMRGLKAPTREETFQTRLKIWKYYLTEYIIKYPFGHGLGSGTLAAGKFGSESYGTESYLFALLPCSGIIGFFIFIYLFYLLFRNFKDVLKSGTTYRIAFSILSLISLSSFFGYAFGLTCIGPIGWFFAGVLARFSKKLPETSEMEEKG